MEELHAGAAGAGALGAARLVSLVDRAQPEGERRCAEGIPREARRAGAAHAARDPARLPQGVGRHGGRGSRTQPVLQEGVGIAAPVGSDRRAGQALHAAAVLFRGELLLAREACREAGGEGEEVSKQELMVDGLAPPISHYCDAVRFGDLLFISGVPPTDAKGAVVGGDDVAQQTRQVFRNMKLVLEAAGASFADILKVTVYLLDVDDRSKINPVRKEYFGAARPASTLIGVRELAIPGMKVEIEAVVGLRRSEKCAKHDVMAMRYALALLTAAICMAAYAQDQPRVPQFEVDASWPKTLPNRWILGQVSGIATDRYDRIWVVHRPGSLTPRERAAERTPPEAKCCVAAPPVLVFDASGNFLFSWGGPGAGYQWPESEHGIYVDANDSACWGGKGRR